MTSPTKRSPNTQQARLTSQIAELGAERDSLIRSLRPLLSLETAPQAPPPTPSTSDTNEATPTAPDNQSQLSQAIIDAVMTESNKVVKEHIKLLHAYNGIRDVGHGLMGMIADQRGVRVKDVMEEFGIDAKD